MGLIDPRDSARRPPYDLVKNRPERPVSYLVTTLPVPPPTLNMAPNDAWANPRRDRRWRWWMSGPVPRGQPETVSLKNGHISFVPISGVMRPVDP